MLRALLLVTSFFLVSCTAEAKRRCSYEHGVLQLAGQIDQVMLDCLSQVDQPIRTVQIRSFGGRASISEAIVDRIGAGQYDVVVLEHCYSACMDIFLAARRKRVGPNAFVAFHRRVASDVAFFEIARRSDPGIQLPPNFREAAERERLAYQRWGIDPRLNYLVGLSRGRRCYFDADAAGPSDVVFFAYQFGGVIPSNDTLEAFGVHNIEGEMIKDEASHLAIIERMAREHNFSILHARQPPDAVTTPDQVSMMLRSADMRPCSPSIASQARDRVARDRVAAQRTGLLPKEDQSGAD